VFAGPRGIALSGLLAVYIQSKAPGGAAWQIYGVLALMLVTLVARYLPRGGSFTALRRTGTAGTDHQSAASGLEL
jgi:hypothetical protein